MRYLGLALFAEGPTDHLFLRPLLRRVCEQHCSKRGTAPVEVGDAHELHSPDHLREESRERRILEAARVARGSWQILFIHTDGASDPKRACVERIEPAMQAIARDLDPRREKAVAVVPIRETEAWALVDGEALRRTLGTNATDDLLGLPSNPREAEKIPDPKQVLEKALASSRSRRRRRISVNTLLEPLGEIVSFDQLRALAAFQDLETHLAEALRGLRFIR